MKESTKTWKIIARVALAVVCLFALSSTAASKARIFIAIDYPDAVHTSAFGINPAGDIVGSYFDSSNHEHGFVLRNGTFTSFDWPGATWTEAYGINPRGDIVGQYGWSESGTNTVHGFLLRDDLFHPVDVTGEQNTMPFKISPDGVIVGCNHHNVTAAGGTDLNTMKGFMLEPSGAVSQFTIRSMNTGVNPDGDAVGYYYGTISGTPSSRPEWSYLIRGGVATLFQFPGAFATLANDINASGTIVGAYRATSQTPAVFHGFVVQDGTFETIDVPAATQTRAFGISATGDIVGYYVDSTGHNHGFLFSRSVPE